MKAENVSADVRELIKLLARYEVRYLLVGGTAVIYHGYARFTGDTDVWYEPSPDNAKRLHAALRAFWDDSIPGDLSAEDLVNRDLVLQFGNPPNRIDLLGSISGVEFAEAWNDRVDDTLETQDERTPIHLLGIRSLRANKAASGRHKDMDDLENLPES